MKTVMFYHMQLRFDVPSNLHDLSRCIMLVQSDIMLVLVWHYCMISSLVKY